MKTAEEILENIMCCTIEEDADLDVKSNYYYQHDDVVKAIEQTQKEATEIAFQEGQSNPKIKQLEWEKFEKGEDLISKVLFGDYIISDNYVLQIIYNRVREGHSFFNLNDAKQFAQLDFEARVKKCLITKEY